MENKKVKIKDVVKLINGYPFEPSDWENKGKSIIRIQNLNNPLAIYNKTTKEVHKKYYVEKGDILISWSGTLGIYEWDNDAAYLNQHIYKVNFISNEISKKYFKYVIELALNELKYRMRGVGMMHLTKSELDNYEFSLPSLEIQNKIISQLDKIQLLLNYRRKSITLLNEYIKAVFFEMFGDPVVNPKKIKTVFLSNKIFKISTGTTPSRKKNNYFEGDIPWVKSADIKNDFIFETKETISNQALTDTGLKIFPKNSVLIAMYGQGKTRGRVSILGIEASCNQACAVIQSSEMSHIFIYSVLNYSYEYLRNYSKGGNRDNLSLTILKSLKIINPSTIKQNQYAKEFLNVHLCKQQHEKSLEILEELYNSFLYNSFNDKMIIEDDVDKIMKDELKVETIIQDIKASDFESLTQYNSAKDLLFKILERTEIKNKLATETSKFNKGIVQIYTHGEIEIKTNREHKLDSI